MSKFHHVCHLTLVLALMLPTVAGAADNEPTPPIAALSGKAGGLTADDVARRASATSLAVEERKHDVDAAQAEVDRTLADYFPRLDLSMSYTRHSRVKNNSLGTVVLAPDSAGGPVAPGEPLVAVPLEIGTFENETTLTATLTVPFSDYVFRIVQAHEGATAQRAAAQLSLRATQRKADYDARALYYDWVSAELDAAVAEQNLELGRENLARVNALAAADSASAADVSRIEATVAASDLLVAQSQNVAALQRERLAIAMHDSAPSDYQIGDDFKPAAATPEAYDIAALVQRAQLQRPELKALLMQTRAYEKHADVARSQAFPRLDGFAQGTQANPNPRYSPPDESFRGSWALGVQLTYSPNDTATGLSRAAGASAKAARADAERRAVLDAIHAEVAEAVLAYRTAVVAIETSSRRLAAAETSYRTRRDRFLAEKATTVELTEAQTELLNARLQAVGAQVAIRRARARIAYVSGSEAVASL
jgi:outer membrane protein